MAQNRVDFLVQKANSMFPEGVGAPKAFARDGAAAAPLLPAPLLPAPLLPAPLLPAPLLLPASSLQRR